MVVKNVLVPVSRLKDANGATFKDGEGAMYLVDNSHEALAGKEFANSIEAMQCIQDYNARSKDPFTGELILINVITFE